MPRERPQPQRLGRVLLPLAACEVHRVIGTAWAHFILAYRHSQGYYSYGRGRVPLPSAGWTDVIRMAGLFFAPCRVRSGGSYPHGLGIFCACLAPIAWIGYYSYGIQSTTRTDVTRTARGSFAPWYLRSLGCCRHGMGTFSACLSPLVGVLHTMGQLVILAGRNSINSRILIGFFKVNDLLPIFYTESIAALHNVLRFLFP